MATVAYLGSDGRQYESTSAGVVTPRSQEGLVTLRKGGASEIDFAMDVPAAAMVGGKVLIEETLNLGNDEQAFWTAG